MADSQPAIWRTPPGQKPEGNLVDQLTDYGREKMAREILEALGHHTVSLLDSVAPVSIDAALRAWVKHPGDDPSVERVVESYRRTALIRQDPDFEHNMARAGLPPGEREGRLYTLEELRLELGLDKED